MLNGVHLIDFVNHRNTRLTFGRMTALVGQNGVGKTSVMRAISEVAIAIETHESWRPAPLFNRSRLNPWTIAAAWQPSATSLTAAGVVLGHSAQWYSRMRGALSVADSDKPWVPSPSPAMKVSTFSEYTENTPILEVGVEQVESPKGMLRVRYFKCNVASLRDPSLANPEVTGLKSDGSNLAWALASLMTEHPEKFQKIVDSLREVVPIVKRIRSRATTLTRFEKQTVTINKQVRTFDEERHVLGQELIFDMRSGDNLPAAMVSDGTLVTLALLTLVHGSSEADLLLLDDIELGLHPKAQHDLIRQLRRVLDLHPQLQIILSTHSPYIVDEMKVEDVWVFAPDSDGLAVVHRLDENPNANRALDILTAGEFWSSEGEGWVLDAGGPGPETEATARVAEGPPVT